MPNLNIPITLTGTDVISVLPDGTEYLTNTFNNQQNAIGEKKRVKWKFSTSYNMEEVNIWCQFGTFVQGVLNSLSPKSPIDHAFTFPIGLAAGLYPMAMILPSGANVNLQNNLQAYIEIVDSTHFNIIADFYQIYDETTYQNQVFQDNHNKLLRDLKTSLNDLVLTGAKSCYNSNVSNMCFTARLEKYNQIHLPDPNPYTDNSNPFSGGTWQAGFYNLNPNGNAPYFNTPQFLLTRSSFPVSNFSPTAKTNVEFRVTCPTAPTKILMWIIRTDKFDNNVDMVTNYEANFEDIDSSNANIGSGSNKFSTPVINLNSLGGGVYSVGVAIDGTKLFFGGKYRLIAIVYDNATGNGFVNSFISEEYKVDKLPVYEGNGFNARGAIDDYHRQFRGNDLECCIEERIRAKVKLYFPFNKWKNDILNRLGLVTSNDIRRYMTSVNVEIFEEYTDTMFGLGDVKNIFESYTSNKIGATSYSAQNGLTLNFGNTWFEMLLEFRNRFEANTPNLQTLINGVNTIPVMTNQYWGGRTLKIRWTLTFFYDNYSTPFTEEIVFNQQIRVKDYGEMAVRGYDPELNDFDINDYICDDETLCFLGVLQNPSLPDRKLITNIYPKGSGVASIEEAEVWVGNELPQLTTNKITDQDEDYSLIASETAAKFCIDGTKLLVNSYYVISALAKKYYESKKRIIESGSKRITEETDKRIIE